MTRINVAVSTCGENPKPYQLIRPTLPSAHSVNALTAPLHDHHKFCDALFADAEAAVAAADWKRADIVLQDFLDELEAHFLTEENVLFPAFESVTGMTGGPTRMMRIEHAQMRELAAQLRAAANARGADAFAGAAETLLIFMQQHNMKEENILYPMCDRSLVGGIDALDTALDRQRELRCRQTT